MYRVILQVLTLCMSVILSAQLEDRVSFQDFAKLDVSNYPVTTAEFGISQYNGITTIAYGSGSKVVINRIMGEGGQQRTHVEVIELANATVAVQPIELDDTSNRQKGSNGAVFVASTAVGQAVLIDARYGNGPLITSLFDNAPLQHVRIAQSGGGDVFAVAIEVSSRKIVLQCIDSAGNIGKVHRLDDMPLADVLAKLAVKAVGAYKYVAYKTGAGKVAIAQIKMNRGKNSNKVILKWSEFGEASSDVVLDVKDDSYRAAYVYWIDSINELWKARFTNSDFSYHSQGIAGQVLNFNVDKGWVIYKDLLGGFWGRLDEYEDEWDAAGNWNSLTGVPSLDKWGVKKASTESAFLYGRNLTTGNTGFYQVTEEGAKLAYTSPESIAADKQIAASWDIELKRLVFGAVKAGNTGVTLISGAAFDPAKTLPGVQEYNKIRR